MSCRKRTGMSKGKGNSLIKAFVWTVIVCMAVMLLPAGPAGADITGVTITEYGGLTANSGPNAIAAGPDGAMWFTEFSGDRIGRIDMSGNVTEYSTGITASSFEYHTFCAPSLPSEDDL